MRKKYAVLPILAVLAALVIAGCGSSSSSSTSSGGGEASGAEAASETESSGGRYGGEEAEAKPSSEAKPASEKSGGGEAVAVSLGSASGVGKVLVDPEGMTLYYFQKDQNGSGKSKCEGACAEAWPPLLAAEGEATSGVDSAMLGTIERADGTTQVTYAGWPLYTFVEDEKPGEDNGTDSKAFGASWYPLHGNGKKAGH